jgi:hypothetical protein
MSPWHRPAFGQMVKSRNCSLLARTTDRRLCSTMCSLKRGWWREKRMNDGSHVNLAWHKSFKGYFQSFFAVQPYAEPNGGVTQNVELSIEFIHKQFLSQSKDNFFWLLWGGKSDRWEKRPARIQYKHDYWLKVLMINVLYLGRATWSGRIWSMTAIKRESSEKIGA